MQKQSTLNKTTTANNVFINSIANQKSTQNSTNHRRERAGKRVQRERGPAHGQLLNKERVIMPISFCLCVDSGLWLVVVVV